MAKYDWKQLEKEYILSDYKSVSAFLKSKEIKNNGTTRKYTVGWKEKKRQKEDKKATKIIEIVTEKESEKEAQQIVDIKLIANDLALNIIKANKESNLYIDKYGETQIGLIDKKGLKQLTSALKDLNDILSNKQNENSNAQSLAETIQKAYENKVGDK